MENETSNSNDLKTYWLKPRLKGDSEIIFAGINSNLFYGALNSINIKSALDLGCGQGTLLTNLRKYINGLCCAIDLSSTVLKTTKHEVKGVNYVASDGLMVPFRSNIFDFIECTMLIEHVNDVSLVREIGRLLKHRGILLLSTVLKKRGATYFYKNRKGERVLEPTHLREYNSVDEVQDILESNGLKIREISIDSLKFSPLDPFFRYIYSIFPSEGTSKLHMQKLALLMRKSSRVPIPRYAIISLIAQKDS